jgi:hypothetical protein
MGVGFTAFAIWLTTVVTSVALAAGPGGAPMARYVIEKGPAGVAAPEIDGPGGVAALALLVSVALIAYNRFRQK